MAYERTIEARTTARHKGAMRIAGRAGLKGKKVLDVGCGIGVFSKFAVESGAAEVCGIDVKEGDIRLAKKFVPKASFRVASALKLPFKDCYFDFAAMVDVLEHLPRRSEEAALGEINRVLKKGGSFLLSTPKNSVFNFLDIAWFLGHRHYSEKRIREIFEGAGFKVLKVESAGGFFEYFGVLLYYFFKNALVREMPFKAFFDRKREGEYAGKGGFATIYFLAKKA